MSKQMKKIKQRGDSIIIRTKKKEPSFIMDWFNCQTNISESIRYLIEKEVAANGVHDLYNDILNRVALMSNNTNSKSNKIDKSIQPKDKQESATTLQLDSAAAQIESKSTHNNSIVDVQANQSPELEIASTIEETPVELNQDTEEKSPENPEPVKVKAKSKMNENRKPVGKREINLNNW